MTNTKIFKIVIFITFFLFLNVHLVLADALKTDPYCVYNSRTGESEYEKVFFDCGKVYDGHNAYCKAPDRFFVYKSCSRGRCQFDTAVLNCSYQSIPGKYCKGCGIRIVNSSIDMGCKKDITCAIEWVQKCERSCKIHHSCGSDGYCKSGSRKGVPCFGSDDACSYWGKCSCSEGSPGCVCENTNVVKGYIDGYAGLVVHEKCCGGAGSAPPTCDLNACCTPPSCGSGYTTTPNSCAPTTVTCSNASDCNDQCIAAGRSNKRNCYPLETNIPPSIPTWNKLSIGDRTSDNLSQDEDNPTLVPLPLSSTTSISSSTNTIAIPPTSGGVIYNFEINGETISQDTNTVNSKPAASTLTEGKTGSITSYYSTKNKCDTGIKAGPKLTTYYKVNTLPVVNPISTSLTISGTDEKPMGCEASASFSGQESNNPITVTIKGTDPDGTNNINGVFLWIVKDGVSIPTSYINKRYAVGPGATKTDPNIIGLFLGKATHEVYKSNNASGTLLGWGRDVVNGTPSYKVQDGNGKVLIEKVTIVSRGVVDGEFTYVIELKFPETSPLSGNYKFYTTMTDPLTYYPISGVGTYVELRTLYHNAAWNWNFDFVAPTVSNLTGTVNDQQLATVNWNSDGTGSSIKDTVVNVYNPYNAEETRSVIRKLPVPEDTIEVSAAPSSTSTTPIGAIDSLDSGWYYNSPISSTQIDIDENDSGELQFYITVYDQACNYISSDAMSSPSFDLNRWISTRGGILFSMGAIRYEPKQIEGKEYNLGTELITTAYGIPHPQTINIGRAKNPTSVINIVDSNTLGPNRFDLLKSKLDRYKLSSSFKSITSLNECTAKDVCILESKESIDIGSTDPTGESVTITTYQGKILVVSEQDIIVRPNITAIANIQINPGTGGQNPETSGLILFAGGNIIIDSTSRTTGEVVQYDVIDAFMIARGQIQVLAETNRPDKLQDGVKVSGSLISFAKNNNDLGLLLQRDLGLLNVTNPVLIVNYHPKYTKISELFFGTDTSTYKQEVGFKTF